MYTRKQILPVIRDLVGCQRPDTARVQIRERAEHSIHGLPDRLTGRRAGPGRRYPGKHTGPVVRDPSQFPCFVEGSAETRDLVHEAPLQGFGAGPDPAPGYLFQGVRLQTSARDDAVLELSVEGVELPSKDVQFVGGRSAT